MPSSVVPEVPTAHTCAQKHARTHLNVETDILGANVGAVEGGEELAIVLEHGLAEARVLQGASVAGYTRDHTLAAAPPEAGELRNAEGKQQCQRYV